MVLKEVIDLDNLNLFSSLVKDYSGQKRKIKPFISSFPSKKSILNQIKKVQTSNEIRLDLVSVLKKQYKGTYFLNSNLKKVNNNINILSFKNTYTITAGHQINIFANPLFMIYKIINIINLSSEISKISKKNIIPIFWIASEDHDFDEIKSFNLFNETHELKKKYNNHPVGCIKTKGLDFFIENLFNSFEDYPYKKELKRILVQTYTKNNNLSDSIRSLLTYFFGKHGLLILDPNDSLLKKHFIPVLKEEILNQTSFNLVSKQTKKFSKYYKPIVKPRELNLFYFYRSKRFRVLIKKDKYFLLNSSKQWTQLEILKEIKTFPERFSPNVILRTLYQEMILPNLVYVAGPSEISYWLQFKLLFSKMNKEFPILILRSFVLNINWDDWKLLNKNKININDILHPLDHFLSKSLYKKSKINLINESNVLRSVSKSIIQKTKKIDNSLNVHASIVCKKLEKTLLKLEKKIIKNQKKDHTDFLSDLTRIYFNLYYKNLIQERSFSYIPYYLKYGDKFFDMLLKKINCLENGYIILKGI